MHRSAPFPVCVIPNLSNIVDGKNSKATCIDQNLSTTDIDLIIGTDHEFTHFNIATYNTENLLLFHNIWERLNFKWNIELVSLYLSDINDCDPNPCVNGGVCHNGINSYTCTCAEGYNGKNCSESML